MDINKMKIELEGKKMKKTKVDRVIEITQGLKSKKEVRANKKELVQAILYWFSLWNESDNQLTKLTIDHLRVQKEKEEQAKAQAATPCIVKAQDPGYGFCPYCGADSAHASIRDRSFDGSTVCGACGIKTKTSEWKDTRMVSPGQMTVGVLGELEAVQKARFDLAKKDAEMLAKWKEGNKTNES